MSFMLPYKDLNPNLNKLASSYIGIVEDVNDPMKLQRIKVRVKELFGTLETSVLPWCIKKSTPRNKNTVGEHNVPSVGQYVIVEFDNGCIYSPTYSLGYLPKSLQDFSEDYNSSHGYLDEFGNLVKIGSKGIYIKDTFNNLTIFNEEGIQIHDHFGNIQKLTEAGLLVEGSASGVISYPSITLNGNVKITGSLVVDQGITTNIVNASEHVEAAGKVLESHTHTSGEPGAPTSGPN